MEQYVKPNRTEIFSPVCEKYNQDLKSVFETDNLFSQILPLGKIRTIKCNSLLAEETINVIIGYFNEKSILNTNFKKSVLHEIKNIELTYPNDNEKLKANIEANSEDSLVASANGMKTILNAFIKYSDFVSNSNANYFEDIDYVTEPINEVYDSTKIWLEQTIDEPWFK
ncbi:MAG: hypothetical protein ABIP68_07055 [Ferruginibacter sp.]